MKTKLLSVTIALGLGLTGPVLAQDAEATQHQAGPLQVIRQDDSSLTCVQVADEAAQLSQTMGGEPGDSVFGRLGGVARTGVAMLVPGAGLVMAGADALTKPAADRREAEALAVQNRWYYLNGVYAGRRCHERAEAASAVAPVPAAAATAQPIATGTLTAE